MSHSDLTGAIHQKITERERASALHGRLHEHEFVLDVYGPGRLPDTLCTFGVAFTRQPAITPGLALHPGDTIFGPTPRVRVAAHRWAHNAAGLYIAAHVSVTVTGHRRQRSKVTILFSGIGVSYPLGPNHDSFSFDDPLP